MSKSLKNVTDMLDYVRQLRRHTEGRRAIHVKLSNLEKHFREEHYRRFVATALRPLITKFGATMFALPNADVVLMVKDASVDTIDPLLNNIRRKYKDSELVSSIDAVQGVSDEFVNWFDLEEEYAEYLGHVQQLADSLLASGSDASNQEETPAHRKRTPGMLEIKSRPVERLKPAKKMKMVSVEAGKETAEARDLDVELLHSVIVALQSADVSGLHRKQRVMAILGDQPSQAIMVHHFVPIDVVFEVLLQADVQAKDRALTQYLENFLSGKFLASEPNLRNEQSLASSLRISCESVCSSAFDKFEKSLGTLQRSKVIVEFSVTELMTNYSQYLEAYKKLENLGFKLSVADMDPRMLLWMDYSDLKADFVKLKRPFSGEPDWLTSDLEGPFKTRIQKIGLARIILDGCMTKADIETGQRLGITLFQGTAVNPVSTS